MASDASMAVLSSSVQEDDHDRDDGYHPPSLHSLSRLSMCTSSMYTNEDTDDYQDCDGIRMFVSRLSIESFDADEELSDDQKEGNHKDTLDLSSDSDKETGCCYSLPATSLRWRNRGGLRNQVQLTGVTDYASENEAQKGIMRPKMRKNLRKRTRQRWKDNNNMSFKKTEEEITGMSNYGSCNSFSGESEGGGLVVITRPKGGSRSLCMDLEEVKACRDLGFELEHERMLEIPSCRLSLSGSTLDTSSGGNSPLSNWRISSPGDDPRDVKARLKVWAQVVATASASRHGGI
ncbi:hypothetical protein SADUNF_Sadunf02G0157000 [Salix dunnii]|uniref:Fold protein n=1 Tax=Salix dunnii TaxID=1413687 RepID=A0A835N8G8_9ROSI|nr:hypothetical protein SADUNF_Sadunf02G0157000 [Salix dunnii]